jgi:UDP-N-acetyl-D-mannosaminuronic acid dehydrogenase
MRACFYRAGHIGLPTAIVACRQRHRSNRCGYQSPRGGTVNRGKIHIVEPGSKSSAARRDWQSCAESTDQPRWKAMSIWLCVPTPFTGNHQPDISYVEAATRQCESLLKAGDLYIMSPPLPSVPPRRWPVSFFQSVPNWKIKSIFPTARTCAAQAMFFMSGYISTGNWRHRRSFNRESRRFLQSLREGNIT